MVIQEVEAVTEVLEDRNLIGPSREELEGLGLKRMINLFFPYDHVRFNFVSNDQLILSLQMSQAMVSDLVPGQRLKIFAFRWKHFHVSPIIKKLVKFGYKMKFDTKPKLSVPRSKFETYLPREQMDVIRKSVAEFLEKGAVRKLSYDEACKNPGFYSKLFAVPKPNGTWRMIIDMRKLNSHISKQKFRMQGIKDVRNALKKNMYGAVNDISDAYYHISIHKRARKYTRFILDG